MNKKEFLEKLNFLFDENVTNGLVLYFILKTEDEFIIRQADIDRETVEPKLREQFLRYLKENVTENEDLNFANLSTSDSRKNTVYFYDFDEIPDGLEVMQGVLENEEQQFFDFRNDEFDNIFGFIILLGNENNKVALYKKHYPVNLIKRDSVFFIKDNTRLVNLEDEIIRISESFDFLQVEGEKLILNLNTLEKYFGFEKVIKNKAIGNIQVIKKWKLLEDIALLEEMAADLRFAKKLMKVKSDSAVSKVEFPKIRDFVRHHPGLKHRVRFNINGSRLALDTKTSAYLFLKLLDDDFLKSELTDFLYETDTKNLLNKEENDEL